MPRQCILTAADRSALLAFPTEKSELIFLSFMISLAEFSPLSVEDSSG
jgi:hypothetical protein